MVLKLYQNLPRSSRREYCPFAVLIAVLFDVLGLFYFKVFLEQPAAAERLPSN
jgi:hypothetical protein